MTDIESLLAERAIVNTVTGYMVAVDTRRWDEVAGFFAEEVYLDYTSVRAAHPAQTIRRDEMVGRWRTRYELENSYQHALSNLLVRIHGGEAICTGNNTASHVMDDPKDGNKVLWQIGVRLTWKLSCAESLRWVIRSVEAEYVWDRTEPFAGIRIP